MAKITPREIGYRAYRQFGVSARCPYERDERSAEQWWRGFRQAETEWNRRAPSEEA